MKKILLIFTANWCGPCKTYKANLDNQPINVDNIRYIDVDENKQLVKMHNIRSVPMTILYKEGLEDKRKSGVMTAAQLNEFVS